jgi:hypothetical protein
MPSTAAPTERPLRWMRRLVRGDTLRWSFVYATGPTADAAVPVDLTGWSVRVTVRDGATGDVLTAISSPADVQTNDVTTGGVLATIAAADTAAWPVTTAGAEHPYDFEFTAPGGLVSTKILGTITVLEDQSR